MNAAAGKGAEQELARRLLSQRRQREELLGPELASEPAWTMLLALFIAHEEGKPARVAEVCAAAGTPPATALRWLATVASEGKIRWGTATRSPDGDSIELAPDLAERLRKLFRAWIEDMPKASRR
jgi:hypothetical protein